MQNKLISALDVSKQYRHTLALDKASLTVYQGDIYGFIGENGAGKTTMIRLLTGLAQPTSGTISIFGQTELKQQMKSRSRLGCIIEAPALYDDMTARQNLEVQRLQRGIPGKHCIENALSLVNLTDTGKKPAKNFSLGMRQRLALAIALLGEPEVLILDEPVNGLDPTGIVDLRELIKRLNKEKGMTILISSHNLNELHHVATRYGIIHKGRMLQEISSQDLDTQCKKHVFLRVDDKERAAAVLEHELKIRRMEALSDAFRIYEYLDQPSRISPTLSAAGIGVIQISIEGDDLEAYFAKTIGSDAHA